MLATRATVCLVPFGWGSLRLVEDDCGCGMLGLWRTPAHSAEGPLARGGRVTRIFDQK